MYPEMTSTASANDPQDSSAAQSHRPWLETPLDPTRSCIRILRLRKGSSIMPIVCDLNVASLDDDPTYEALSYTWGDPKITTAISVGGVGFLATQNLFDFLSFLRSPTADRFLWADAICIDQTNDEEKIHQIKLMTKIYKYAGEMHIWFGAFTSDWEREIKGDGDYILMADMTPETWKDYEKNCFRDLEYFKRQDGFRPLSRAECEKFKRRCLDDIFHQTFAMLDRKDSEHNFTHPVFFFDDNQGSDQKYRLNRSWVLVLDCIRWLLTRSWWTRVWTLQEAVLPRTDPTVHASPYSFKLSRLLNGIQTLARHNNSSCCKWFGGVVLTLYRNNRDDVLFIQPLAIHSHRENLKDPRQEWIPLQEVVHSIQRREATEIRDRWFGIFGLLQPDWQEQDKSCTEAWTTAELFTKCSKLLYGACGDLTRLDLARRLNESKVSDLPSWAIDLSAQYTDDSDDYQRWILYNAAPETVYEAVQAWSELKTPDLTVRAIRVGTVSALGERIPLGSIKGQNKRRIVHEYVGNWRKLYRENLHVANNEDAFWRTVFMDRDRFRDWMHERTRPLYGSRLTDMSEWFNNWTQTGDEYDLDTDKKAGGSTRGRYHYKALDLNVRKTKFFVMADGVPGMGPHGIQAEDEVYVIAGCKSPAVLRQGKWNGMDGFTVVGLCFVDGWMYGRATEGNPTWETIQLF